MLACCVLVGWDYYYFLFLFLLGFGCVSFCHVAALRLCVSLVSVFMGLLVVNLWVGVILGLVFVIFTRA